jgi:competence protein ComEC
MVEALVLARREHLDPDLRAAFGLSGTAHLLAISGFHVGVVAGLLLGALRLAGLHPRRAALGSALGAWGYVLAIGAPDAALRASVLLSLLAFARIRGRPAVSVGTLSTAFLGLLLVDPAGLRSVGFQLSFAGTLGLVTLRSPLENLVDGGWRRLGRPPPRRRPGASTGERWLRGSSEGVVAGVAATLPTLPFLAWHFDRVSLVGIPATLVVAPWVSLAIPGIGAALGVSILSMPAGRFLAGGVDTLLAGVEGMVLMAADLPGAALWVSRSGLLAAGAAGGGAWWGLRRWTAGRIRPRVRETVSGLAGLIGVLLVPLLPGPSTLELHLIDVGQGDALALRFPDGGWVVVDAGPRGAGWDAGARRVVPYLRRAGVRRLEALVLTHPHLDHLGGAPALLQEFPVRGVLDPAVPVPSRPYLEVQEEARSLGISWWGAREGQVLRRRGVEIRVLHPHPSTPPVGGGGDPGTISGGHGGRHQGGRVVRQGDGSLPPDLDANDLSVVLLVSFGSAHILLTGDAYAWVEEAILPRLPPLTALKLGHHGSRTSTSQELLQAAQPAWGLIPVGDGNRYGHPHGEVLERLGAAGVRVLRTDRDGSVRLRIRPDGSVTVRTTR